jgi:proton glutamate symport protein
MILGISWGIFASGKTWGPSLTIDYIKPFGTIFIRLLQMVAVPLILSSLISSIARLKDMSTLVRMGGKTILLFLFTALIATSLGIFLVNISEPGKSLPVETREKLMSSYSANTATTIGKAKDLKESPLSTFVDMVPNNIFGAASDNTRMIEVVFFALLFGVALSKLENSKSELVVRFFDNVNEALIKMTGMVMQFAPIGVFALMAAMIVDVSGKEVIPLLLSLMNYGLTVIAGLLLMLFVIYPLLFTTFSKIRYGKFFKEMRPAFLLAFSTSSSSATLPVTIERVEKHLGIQEEVSGFVLPLGTTINMDGTALYQSVAAVFIAQALGMDLSILQMALVVLTATIAAAGAAGVPGAGVITLVIVLESIGVPAAGIALIMAPDRILDMCRTVVNVAGDATVTVVIAESESSRLEVGK